MNRFYIRIDLIYAKRPLTPSKLIENQIEELTQPGLRITLRALIYWIRKDTPAKNNLGKARGTKEHLIISFFKFVFVVWAVIEISFGEVLSLFVCPWEVAYSTFYCQNTDLSWEV